MPCYEVRDQPSAEPFGWDYQVCNEMVMPIYQSGITDMFPVQPFNPDAYLQQCQATKGLTPQWDWALDTFGGRNTKMDFKHTSNIIFSNGDLDPWRAGGVLEDLGNKKITVRLIKGGAHHLDLKGDNAADPQDVLDARNEF